MNIGILTFHDGINHGAFFQAYSTFRFLKEQGYETEIINYKNRTHLLNEYRALIVKRNPWKLVQNLKKLRKFRKAQREFKNGHVFTSPARLRSDKYDVVVIGADIVWNYQWGFLGSDPVYFGIGLEPRRLIAYAPSCGNLDLHKPIPDFVRNGLRRFDSIAVRDELTQSLVRKVTGDFPEIVVDPTFLCDVRGKEVEIESNRDFILVYAFGLSQRVREALKDFAKSRNMRLISIGYSNSWCDENRVAVGPFEWLGFFKCAAYVVSSTFHGTIYAIKYRKQFVTIDNPAISSKTSSLLQRIGAESRLVNESELNEALSKKVSFDSVDRRLSPWVETSRRYLLGALFDKGSR